MKPMKLLLVALLLVCGLPFNAHAQLWKGIIAPGRAMDWRNAGVGEGITHRTKVCSTLNPGTTSSQINTAIANCPQGQVVMLNAGTYNLGSGIINMRTGITLRGAGAE